MRLERIGELIALVGSSGIARLELEEDGSRIVIVAGGEAVAAPVPVAPGPVPPARPVAARAPDAAPATIRSPGYGVLHLSPSPGAPPYVSVGQIVEAAQPVALVEAMKTFTTIKAGQAGRIEAVLCVDGDEIEIDTALFRLEGE